MCKSADYVACGVFRLTLSMLSLVIVLCSMFSFFFFQAEDGIRDLIVTGVQTCALPIFVPPDYAAEMVAYEAAVGELRAHYAGFFDPGFGYGAGDLHGTPIVLEVRPHEDRKSVV